MENLKESLFQETTALMEVVEEGRLKRDECVRKEETKKKSEKVSVLSMKAVSPDLLLQSSLNKQLHIKLDQSASM